MRLEDLRQLSARFRSTATPEDYVHLQEALREMGLDPNNLYQELEMSYRFVQAHQDISYSNTFFALHSHSFCEILCCRTSCGAEYLVGAERYRLQKGDIIVVPPGVSHRPLLPENLSVPYVRDVFWLSTDFLGFLTKFFPQPKNHITANQMLLRTTGTQWTQLPELLRAAVQESETQKSGWDRIVIGNALTFLSLLNRAFLSGDAVRVTAEKPELLDQVMAYIEENLSHKITLADTARCFYVSSSTIGHLFQKKMGVSFYRCVTQRRLITAKKLIEAHLPMDTVAERTGFSDYSAFYRAFKQEYGINPRQYRVLQQEHNP